MKTAVWSVLAVAGVLAFAGTASAQDWMVTPTPAMPLHVMPAPPAAPAPAAPPAGPTATPPPTHSNPPAMANDPVRRLLDPYGLSDRRYSVSPAPDAQPMPLSSFWLVVPWKGTLQADRPSVFAGRVSDRLGR